MNIILWIIVFFLFLFPLTRFIIFNFPIIFIGGIKDLYKYVRFKRWRECSSFGKICDFTGLFGQGKTKEGVRFIVGQYEKYNGLMIYDFSLNKWVEQKINIYSNVKLNIPYIELTSLKQLVDCQNSPPGTVSLFFIDEASVVFNSREFKTNFSTPALNTILTSRHHKIGIYLTSQRFGHMDALLRQVTTYVYECKYYKMLRIQQIKVFDAWEVENCSNVSLLKPLRVKYSYSSDKVYNNYDTYAMVKEISKKCEQGDFVPDLEILNNQGVADTDIRLINKPKRKLKKRM